jgi:hypothetical protein
MKMTVEDYDKLCDVIVPQDKAGRRRQYFTRQFKNSAIVKDLDKRYRWDLLFFVPTSKREPLMKELYTYLNDDHIDTALRAIVPALSPPYHITGRSKPTTPP